MPQVIFKFDKNNDLLNIWDACNSDSKWRDFTKGINPHILDLCKKTKFKKAKKEIERYYRNVHGSVLIKPFIKAVNDSWKLINNEFFRRLEKIMGRPICSRKFTGYMTIIARCP